MDQFNQEAAEKIARYNARQRADELMIFNAIKQYYNESQPPPTPEIIDFDLDKLKTGEWNIEHLNGWQTVDFSISIGCLVVLWVNDRFPMFYNPESFGSLRLIRKPVPTKKVWYVTKGPYSNEQEAKETVFLYGGKLSSIEEPINQEKK